jgi:hypothetical protein
MSDTETKLIEEHRSGDHDEYVEGCPLCWDNAEDSEHFMLYDPAIRTARGQA